MSNLLEQLGITREEVIDRIVNKALGLNSDSKQVGKDEWETVPFSEVVDQKIEQAIGNILESAKTVIQNKIFETVDREAKKVFDSPFQMVNRFGEPTGDLITIRDLIANESLDYWNTEVDEKGQPVKGGYYSVKIKRSQYYARKIMTEVFDKELVTEVKKMAIELKNKIPSTISEEISKIVTSYLK